MTLDDLERSRLQRALAAPNCTHRERLSRAVTRVRSHCSLHVLFIVTVRLRWRWIMMMWSSAMNGSLDATGWRPCVADWSVVCLHAAPQVQLFAGKDNYMDSRSGFITHPISCQFRACKALLHTSLTHMSSKYLTFIFMFPFSLWHNVLLELR